MKIYAQYMRDQVTELLTNYGRIDILWFDFSYPNPSALDQPWMKGKGKEDWESEKLIALARELQPGIIIDNRSDLEQDLWTPEQYQVLEWVKHAETGELVTWEACQTFSGSWGYHRDESTWKSPKMLIDMLVNTVCIGGNLLMNVGPTQRGYLDKRAVDALGVYADWMKYNSRSIYGCTMAEPEFTAPRGTRLTQSVDGKRLYIHLVEYPYEFLEFRGLADKIDYAQFLHDGSEVLYTIGSIDHFSEARTQCADLVAFKIPIVKPNTIVPVIEVFLK
jgi:alpha-L-fucosidase